MRDQGLLTYKAIASYYDLMQGNRGSYAGFYSTLLNPTMTSLVDIGCGTGMITAMVAGRLKELAAPRPVRVTGLDATEEMLALARQRYPTITWVCGDICTTVPERPFDYAISCYNTLQHFAPAALGTALAAIRRFVTSGGIFAFDIYQPNRAYLHDARTGRLARSITGEDRRKLEIREDTSFEADIGLLKVDWRLVDPSEPVAPPLAETRFFIWQHDHESVLAALEGAGFRVREKFGDLDRSPFTPSARKQVLVCEAS